MDPQALIEEARRHRRRRWWWTAAAAAVCAALAAALVWALAPGSGGPSRTGGTSSSSGGTAPTVPVTTTRYPGPFVPSQIVATPDTAWVLGTAGKGTAARCSLQAAGPTARGVAPIPLPACGGYVAAGGGRVYVAASFPVAGTPATRVHLEVVDPATRSVVVERPVVTTQVGSSLGHMDLVFGAGSLWLWVAVPDVVLRITPATGAVVQTVTGLPPSADGHASVAVTASALWLAPGAGLPAALYRAALGSASMAAVWRGGSGRSVIWLSAAGARVWAETVVPGRAGSDPAAELLAFDGTGRVVVRNVTGAQLDAPFVAAGSRLWSVGSGGSCAGPQRLWAADPATGALRAVAVLPTTVAACLTERPDGSQLAAVAGSVAVLEPTGSVDPPALLHVVGAGSG